ncbi:MAG: PspC domain-containing protein [Marmoricola sp.]
MTSSPDSATAPRQEPADDGPRLGREQLHDLDRLRRSSTDRYLAGVAGGIGRHLDIDPVIVRVVLVAACFFGGAGLFFYVALWLLVPSDDRDHAPIRLGPDARRVAVVVVAALAGVGLVGSAWGGYGWRFVWPLGVVVLVVALVARSRRGAPPPAYDAPTTGAESSPSSWQPPSVPAYAPPPPRRPRRTGLVLFWPTLALIALGWGALGLFDMVDPVGPAHWPAVALGITAVMLLVGAFVGRPGGLIPLGLLLAAALVVTAVLGPGGWPDQKRTFTPVSAAAVAPRYHLSNGTLLVDLSQVRDPAALDGRTVYANTDVGEVDVLLPPGVAANVDAGLYVGDIVVGPHAHDGFRSTYNGRFGPPHARTVVDLVLRARAGEIEVHRAPAAVAAARPAATERSLP